MKWLRLEADHSPPSGAEVKNELRYNSFHPHINKIIIKINGAWYFSIRVGCRCQGEGKIKTYSLSSVGNAAFIYLI